MRKKWEIELPQKKENWEVEFSSPEHRLSVEVGGAVPYRLPVASPDQLGGVQPVVKSEEMAAPVGVDEEGKLWVQMQADVATDEEVLDMLIQVDMLPTVADSDGALLADENGDILLW